MHVRTRLVTALREEILGPHGGCEEKLKIDPKEEYVVGVLEPKDFTRGALAFYGRSDLVRTDVGTSEDDDSTDENEFSAFGFIADPRALPKSMGISFVVNAESGTVISLCATWARYIQNEDKTWQRIPFKFIKHNVDVRNVSDLLRANGVRICLQNSQTAQGHHYVSVFLVNETELPKGHHLPSEDHIFQPQLRIVCPKETILVPISGEKRARKVTRLCIAQGALIILSHICTIKKAAH